VDARAADLERRDQPAPKGMIDFERDLTRERARNSEQDRLINGGARRELHSGERAREPGERSIESEPADPRQGLILVAPLNPTQPSATSQVSVRSGWKVVPAWT